MNSIIWDGELATGHDRMDRDHRRAILLINHLADGIENRKGNDFFELLLSEIVRHTKEHFAAEELVMTANDYPDLLRHQAEHKLLIKQADNLKDWLRWGPSVECISLLDFFEYALVIHILSADKALAEATLRDQFRLP